MPRRKPGALAAVDRPLVEEKHRPLLPWVLAGLLLLIILGVAGAFYYSPLVGGEAMRCPSAALVVPAEETEQDGTVGRERCLVTYRADADATFGSTVRNSGPLPVLVTGLDFDSAVAQLLDIRAIHVAADGASAAEGARAAEPFAPFTLRAGEERFLLVQAVLRPCEARREGTLVTLSDLPVRTRFAGAPKTASVPLHRELSVLLEGCDT